MSEAIENTSLAVLSAPLAYKDRRAISQAWYSALHVHTKDERKFVNTPGSPYISPERAPRTALAQIGEGNGPMRAGASSKRARAQTHLPANTERRALRSSLARKIEQAFRSPESPTHTATFALQGTDGRVHITLRSEGSRIRLIAVCAPKAREIVGVALAQARYALASNGVGLDATLELAAS